MTADAHSMPPHGEGKRIGRARRAIAAGAKALSLAAVFSAAASGAVALHAGMTAPRLFAVDVVNHMLEGTFQGKVHLTRVATLRLDRLAGIDGDVTDPEGHRVLHVQGVSARIGTWMLVKSLFTGDRMIIPVTQLDIDHADVLIEDNAAGELGIARAFDSKTPDTGEPSRPTEVSIARIRLGHAWVHGHVAAVPIVDADLDEVAGAFKSTADDTVIDLDRLSLRARGIPGLSPQGDIVAHASLPADAKRDTVASVRYEGRLGEIPVVANASLAGKKVDAVLDVAETAPGAFTAIAPDSIHLRAPVSAHGEVHGELPVLEPRLTARVGSGDIAASGMVTLPEGARTDLVAALELRVHDLDVSQIASSAPPSKLTASLRANVVSRPKGKLSGSFALDNEVGSVSGQTVPAATVSGEFTERSLRGEGQIAEAGAPTIVHFALTPKGESARPTELTFDTRTAVPSLDAIARIGPIGKGHATLSTEGTVDLERSRLDVKVSAEVGAVDVQGVRIGRGFVTGTLGGHLDDPRFAGEVRAAPLLAFGYGFTGLSVTASGSTREMVIATKLVGDDHSPTVSGAAHVSLGSAVNVHDVSFDVGRNGVIASTTVDSIRAGAGSVDVRGVTVRGLGEPLEASAKMSAAGVTVRAKATDIDVARLGKILGREEDVRGHLALDVDATANRREAKGRVEVHLRDVHAPQIDGADLDLTASIERRRLEAAVSASLEGAGKVALTASEVELGGPVIEASAWKKATGKVALSGELELGALLGHVPDAVRPVSVASGTVEIRGSASRPSGTENPSVEVEIVSSKLMLVGKPTPSKNPDGTLIIGQEPWRVAGLDGKVHVSFDGPSGRVDAAAEVKDKRGVLASADVAATPPLAAILKEPDRALTLVGDLPVVAHVTLPRRAIDDLPEMVGKLPVRGEVELGGKLEGTLHAPTFTLSARGTHLRARDAAACTRTIDLTTTVAYDGKKADVHLGAATDHRDVLVANAALKIDLLQAIANEQPLAWEASGDATFDSFPLDFVGPLVEQPLGGRVNGKVALRDLHRDASLEADLKLDGLTLDRAKFPKGSVKATLEGGSFSALARLDQSDGFAEVKGEGTMAWGAEVAPKLDFARAIDVSIRAKNFRASVAQPFIGDSLTELDGRIDSDAKVRVEQGGKEGSMSGSVAIRDGAFEAPQIGEKFHAIRGRVIMKPWGTVRLEGFSAEAPTGKLTASAQAVLSGFSLKTANAKIVIAKGDSIPIAVQGVPMGRAYGNITASAAMAQDGNKLDIHVDVPMLKVDLPQTTGHSVQELDPHKDVRVGFREGLDFATLPLVAPEKPRPPSTLAIRAVIKLGPKVEIKRDTTLDVIIQGQTVVDVTDKTHVTGQIRLVRGKLELQGKMFQIERGVVSFVGDNPSNPMVLATAYWDAPDGTRVYADFSGYVSSGKLNLRSEPALTQDEILALILFGSADGSFGASPPPGQEQSAGAQGVGAAGGVVTQGLNKAISGVTSADITTRVDASEANNPRPEVAVQLTERISARLGYKLGVPAPGDNPDRALLTIDWRFVKNWSLDTEVGDQGSTAVDLVWRLRY